MAQKTINNHKYRADKLPAEESFKLKIRLMQAVGPAMSGLAQMIAGGGIKQAFNQMVSEQDDKDFAGVITALQDLIASLDPDKAFDLLSDTCSKAEVLEDGDWQPIVFGHHLQDLQEAYKVALFVLVVNYQDFFPAKALKTFTGAKAKAS